MTSATFVQTLRLQSCLLACSLRHLALDLKSLGLSLVWMVVSLALGAVLALAGLVKKARKK